MKWIEIVYKCHCMSVERSLHIKARYKDEEILDFMERVRSSIGLDHHSRSPICAATKMEYAKVPIEDNEIGGAKGGTA
jgi:hypothetical protein